MSRRHGIHTDASHRFERGADFESTVLSCDLVAQMILASGGGELVGDVVDVVSKRMDQAPVVLQVSEVQRILGGNLDAGQIFRLLNRLGFILIPEGQARCAIPRADSQLASRRGARNRSDRGNRAASRLRQVRKHVAAYSGAVRRTAARENRRGLPRPRFGLGYNEALSLTFISHADAETFWRVTRRFSNWRIL